MMGKPRDFRVLKICAIVFVIVSVLGTAFLMWATGESTTPVLPEHSTYFVSDYSHVFSEETERFIHAQAEVLQQQTGAQIVLVAVPSTHSMTLEDFCQELFNKWALGDAEKNNGVLLLYTTDAEHVRLQIGYGLEGCLNDAKCGRLLDDYSVYPMDNGEWNRAAVDTWIETAKVVYEEYDLPVPDALASKPEVNENAEGVTLADVAMPEPVTTVDERPFIERLLSNFLLLWGVLLGLALFVGLMYGIGCLFGGIGSVGGGRHIRYGGGRGSSGGGFSGGGGSSGGGSSR